MTTITHVVVDADDVGQRADVVLARRVPELSRRVARALALEGKLRVDGRTAPPSRKVALGETLRLELGDAHADPAGEPRIVVVTDAFVYVDKPAGWHTHRLRPDNPPSLADAVARVHPECATASAEAREGGAIHRLDRETTGIVAFARSPAAWVAGRAAIRDPATAKLYVALGRGRTWPPRVTDVRATDPPTDWPAAVARPPIVEAWSITAPLGRGSDPSRVAVRADGVAAHTIVVPIASGEERIAFVVRLRSGHRHQARVHLAHLGWPIVGDARYDPDGGVQAGLLLLHCASIDLSTRCPGEPRVEVELPQSLLQAFGEAAVVPWAGRRAP